MSTPGRRRRDVAAGHQPERQPEHARRAGRAGPSGTRTPHPTRSARSVGADVGRGRDTLRPPARHDPASARSPRRAVPPHGRPRITPGGRSDVRRLSWSAVTPGRRATRLGTPAPVGRRRVAGTRGDGACRSVGLPRRAGPRRRHRLDAAPAAPRRTPAAAGAAARPGSPAAAPPRPAGPRASATARTCGSSTSAPTSALEQLQARPHRPARQPRPRRGSPPAPGTRLRAGGRRGRPRPGAGSRECRGRPGCPATARRPGRRRAPRSATASVVVPTPPPTPATTGTRMPRHQALSGSGSGSRGCDRRAAAARPRTRRPACGPERAVGRRGSSGPGPAPVVGAASSAVSSRGVDHQPAVLAHHGHDQPDPVRRAALPSAPDRRRGRGGHPRDVRLGLGLGLVGTCGRPRPGSGVTRTRTSTSTRSSPSGRTAPGRANSARCRPAPSQPSSAGSPAGAARWSARTRPRRPGSSSSHDR